MNKDEIKERETEILTFIYENKISLIRHIEGLFFGTYSRARNYLSALEDKGLLDSTSFKHFGGEKIYFMSYQGIQHLKSLGIDAARYKINEKELAHDAGVLDLLVYFMRHEKAVNFTTDYRLRRIRKKENGTYRIPDFIFTDRDNKSGFVEYQLADKPKDIIRGYINDYLSYYPSGFAKYFIVRPGKERLYHSLLSEMNVENFHVGTFDLEKGLVLYSGKSPILSGPGEMISPEAK